MKDGGRLAAAIEVLEEIERRHRPAQVALKDWGTQHRFAGSGDRTAIGNLVFDTLRNRASHMARLGTGAQRMLVFSTYCNTWEHGIDRLDDVLAADRHAPPALTDSEKQALSAAPEVVVEGAAAANVPDWLWPHFSAAFDENAIAEGRALAERAPIDLRANTLKQDRDRILDRLAHVQPIPCPIAPTGVRIRPKPGAARMPHVQAEEGYRKGWFELQDEASQIVSQLAGARPGLQVLDYCAGGGGKTLAMAAQMENKGQIYAYDFDRLRLAPIHERLKRAGVRNVQVRDPAAADLADLTGTMDLVFVDAPCTGTGVWRRRPDSKWRLSEKALRDRIDDQQKVLVNAADFVRPGGTLAYVTCSILPQENANQVDWFLDTHPEFQPVSAAGAWQKQFGTDTKPGYQNGRGDVLLTPASTETDGFFCALLQRNS